jgi:hypothetical protein
MKILDTTWKKSLVGGVAALLLVGLGWLVHSTTGPQRLGGITPPPGLVNVPRVYNVQLDGGATGGGSTDDTTAITSAITNAAALGYKRLYFPAGNYLIGTGITSGNVFSTSVNDLEIYGDGPGKSVFVWPSGQTLQASASMNIWNLSGTRQSFHDLGFTSNGPPSSALTGASVFSGGSGYVAGDVGAVVTATGGTYTTAATFTITSVNAGAVTGVSLTTGGSYTYPGVSAAGNGSVYGTTGGGTAGSGLTVSSSGPQLYFLGINQGCLQPHVYNLDITGTWGLGTAGGCGVSTYQPPQANEFSTTLGTAVGSAGTATVTPGSMLNIYPGRILHITPTNAETITVTSVTTTTFTATFAGTHLATNTVNGWSCNDQYGLFENINVHDSFSSCGFIVNSGHNVFRNCRVLNSGNNNNQHGFYIQEGQNLFDGCRVEGTSGYSYHNHVGSAGSGDVSGNRYVGCWSVNPGNQHFIADNINSNATDPNVPNGTALQRYFSCVGCVFKTNYGARNPSTGVGIGTSGAGGVLTGCIFEDTCPGGSYVSLSSSSSVLVDHCIFRQTNDTGNSTGITIGSNCVISGCQFVNWGHGHCISGNSAPNVIIKGCNFAFNVAGGQCIYVLQSTFTIADNQFVLGASSSATTACISIGTTSLTNIDIHGNYASLQGGGLFVQMTNEDATGQIHHNTWTGSTGGISYTDANLLMDIHDNNGVLNFSGTTTNCIALDSRSGRLLRVTPGTNTLTGGLAVEANGTTQCTTSDTQWLGFATSNKSATNGAFYLAGTQPGSIVKVTTDGNWTAGDTAILSTTTGGTVHDTGGTSVPAAGKSYGYFLDTGSSGAGTATLMVMRTLQ